MAVVYVENGKFNLR